MAEVLENLFTDIADSIREKTGTTEQMLPTEFASRISSIPTGGGGGQTIMVNADYAQNDPTQPDYIKNRPFYEQADTEYKEIITPTTIPFEIFRGEELSNGVIPYHFGTPLDEETKKALEDDIANVKVIWDGTEYICNVRNYEVGINIGNTIVESSIGIDTGEPFFISLAKSTGYINLFDIRNNANLSVPTIEHTVGVSVLEKVIKKLDSKFIDFAPIAEYIDNYISEALGGDY